MITMAAAFYLATQQVPAPSDAQVVLAGMARSQFNVGMVILSHGATAASKPPAPQPAPAFRANTSRTAPNPYGETTLNITYE